MSSAKPTEEQLAESRRLYLLAEQNAKRVLKPGDRVRVSKCPGTKRWITFASWSGHWMVSKSGIDDYSPGAVDMVNGSAVDFKVEIRIAPRMNKWTPTTDLRELRRLGKTCEELGELVAVLGRTICQGLDGVDPATGEGNVERITKESADVIAQIGCNIEAFKLDRERINQRVGVKAAQMAEWEAHFGEPAESTSTRQTRKDSE